MKKSTKIITTAVLAAALSVGSFAAGNLISINVDPTVKIKVNGSEFKPKDANGNEVMTFIYNGTTYAPLRALAEAYGLEVGYDAAANMATVDEPGNNELYFDSYDDYTWDNVAPEYDNISTESEEILYDDGGITIIAKGLSEEFIGTALNLLIENNTNQSITVQARNTSVNGYMISPIMSEDVAPGKRANTTMVFMSSKLEDNGITEITEIETSFHIFESDSWSNSVDTDIVKINFN